MAGSREDWGALLERFGDGDAEAARRLAGISLGYLARFGAYEQRDAWDDIVQEVLIRLWRSRDRIQDVERLLGWLRTTTYNVWATWCARNRVQPRLDEDLPAADVAGGRGVPELVALARALDELPAPQRAVVEAIYLRGLSFAEAGRELAMPEGTLRTHRTRGIKALRRALLAGPSSDSSRRPVELLGRWTG